MLSMDIFVTSCFQKIISVFHVLARVLLERGRMKRYTCTYSFLLTIILAMVLPTVPAGAFQVNFMGRLANFQGIVPSLWSRIAVDKERTEVFTLNPRKRDIRIYNETGMEIFSFGDDIELAGASDLDLGEEGNIYVVYPGGKEYKILRLDYKGEPLANIRLKEFPNDFNEFSPNILQYKEGRLYLVNSFSMDVAVTDINGVFQKGYHLKAELVKISAEFKGRPGEEALSDAERFKSVDLMGFWVDNADNFYFTIPSLFSAFKYTTDGEMKMFGDSGSAPGKFGVVAGITTDSQDNIYVTDRLRSVVMIFDSDFNFRTEFGYRGLGPGKLIVPDEIVVDDEKGFIYVAQAANRGVNVYRIMKN